MDYVNSGHVTAYGPGLIHGMVNKPAVFTVNTKDAGEGTEAICSVFLSLFKLSGISVQPYFTEVLELIAGIGWWNAAKVIDSAEMLWCFSGGLSLAIEGPSKADISCTDNQDGTCTVSYLPVLPGDYNILVKYNDKHIPGSPFVSKITGVSKIHHMAVVIRFVLGGQVPKQFVDFSAQTYHLNLAYSHELNQVCLNRKIKILNCRPSKIY